jgi:hypothetical protein
VNVKEAEFEFVKKLIIKIEENLKLLLDLDIKVIEISKK